jgi:hypothetical protein
MASVNVSVMDFADDIAEPIVPILEALGMIGGDGNDLDLEGWSLEKALGFISSYQRTSAILTVLDLIENIPLARTMHRDSDGHVTSTSSPGSQEEIWQKILDLSTDDHELNLGVTYSRTKLSKLLASDGTNCQLMHLGLFGELKNLSIGSSSNLDLEISLPLLRLESIENGSITKKILLIEDSEGGEEHLSAASIQARLTPQSGQQFTAGSLSCDAIVLRLALSREGVDIELNLDNFVGSQSALPQDLTVSLMQTGQGFNPDFDQLLGLLLNAVPAGVLADHLLPILGLDSSKMPSVPEIGLVGLLLNMNGPSDISNGIKQWALDILTDSVDFESWVRHLIALFTGTDPGSEFLPGQGTEEQPWYFSMDVAATAGEIGLRLWTTNSPDGSYWVHVGTNANFSVQFNPDPYDPTRLQNSIDMVCDLDLLSFPLLGAGTAQTLSTGFLGIEINARDNTLFSWAANSPNLSPSLNTALGNLSGSVGSLRAGLSLGSNHSLSPELTLVDVNISGTLRNIDLLSGGLLDDVLSALGEPFRRALSDMLVSNSYLQRIGALLGLVSPRNDGSLANVRSVMWEGIQDLRIGGITPSLSFSNLFTDPISTIARYHRNLLEVNALPNATGELAGVRPWSLILEAFVDIIHSIVLEMNGGSPIPIRTDGACAITHSTSIDSITETYSADLTTNSSIPRVELQIEYVNSGDDEGKWSVLPTAHLTQVEFGKKLEFDARLIFEMFSVVLPDPTLNDSEATDSIWAEGAQLDLSLGAQMVNSVRPAIGIVDIASMQMTVDSVSAGIEWVAGTVDSESQFGYYFDAQNFQFNGSIPDLSDFFSSLTNGFDLSGIQGISWDGLDLHLPDLSFIRFHGNDRGWWNFDGTMRFSWDGLSLPQIPWPITIPGLSITLPNLKLKHFSGWSIPNFNLRSLNGFDFDFILRLFFPSLPDRSNGGAPWDLSLLFSLPEIRILIGKFLTLRCGRLGLFFAGFFRFDPHFGMFDLGSFLRGNGFEIPKFNWPELPDAWNISLGLNIDGLGMGPFSLPLDWPEIDWTLFLSNPFGALKGFFIELFNGRSKSGQPFALPGLRWLWGLFSGALPDLRLPDLGWGKSSGRTGSGWDGFNWNGINWNGLNWGNLNWNSFEWGKLNWGGLNWGGLDISDIDWNSFDWGGLNWGDLNWGDLNWDGLNWRSLNWRSLDWGSINWGSLNWGSLNWPGLNSGDSNWTGFDWGNFNWSGINWNNLNWSEMDWSFFDWGDFFGGFSGFDIELPEIPISIRGNGTYEDPWAIGLQNEALPDVELLFWLDPDGLPRLEGIPEVFHHLSDQVMGILDNVLAQDSESLPTDWAMSIAQMVSQIAGLNSKVSHAVGNMPDSQIAQALIGFDNFMKNSDGLINLPSQQDQDGLWATVNQSSSHEAHHLNVLRTPSVINETLSFFNSVSGAMPWKVLFVSPPWLGPNVWDDLVSEMVTAKGCSSLVSTSDLSSSSGPVTAAQIMTGHLSTHNAAEDLHLLIPSLSIPNSGTYTEYLELQISMLVDHLTSHEPCKVFLIGHSVGGLAVRYYTEGGPDVQSDGSSVDRDTKVMGALTVSTPHSTNGIESSESGNSVLQVVQMLRLIGSIDPANPPTFDPDDFSEIAANIAGEKNITPEIIEQLAKILLESGMKTYYLEGD